MDRPSRFPMYVGVLVIAAGWAVLIVGWYQAGRQDLETGQIPYVLSGGFGAIGLLGIGGMAVLVDLLRQVEWKAMKRLDDLHSALEEIVGAIERPSRPPRPSREPEAAGTPRRRPRRRRRGPRPQRESDES